MRKIHLTITIVVFLFIYGCKDDNLLEQKKANNTSKTTENQVYIQNGYLHFASTTAFKNYITSIESNASFKSTYSINSIDSTNFTPLSELSNNSSSMKILKSASTDDDEMTSKEYKLMIAENLVKDPALYSILDTSLRISIHDTIYKITEWGTFFAYKTKEKELYQTVNNFSNLKNSLNPISSSYLYQISDGIYFMDSFYKISGDYENDETSSTSERSASLDADKEVYGLDSYRWSKKTWAGKLIDKIFGKDVSKNNKFDSKHRVNCELFDVNYVFYTSAGFKVKMQKRKSFLGIHYWVECSDCDKVSIGIENLYGKLHITNPESNITPLGDGYYGSFTSTINKQVATFLYKGIQTNYLLKDFVNNAFSFTLGKWGVNSSVEKKIYDSSSNEIFNFLKSLNNQYLFVKTNLKSKVKPTDPRIAYSVWGSCDVKTYMTGLSEYKKNNKTIYFNRSFGFSVSYNYNGMHTKGFLPTKFSIESVSIFGAVHYDNRWKGIRFVQN